LRSPRPVLKNLPLLAVIYKAWLWRINKVKLYRPATGEQDAWPGLAPALTRPIRWDRVAEQYDQMVKYATAIRTGTASTEAILRRFMKANAAHPTYQAMIELGRAQKTIFLARYLRSRALWSSPGTARTRSSSTARAAT
jgi:TnpA family transposase